MICTECKNRLSDFIDGHLSAGESLRIQEHITTCLNCNVVHQDLKLIVSASRELPLQSIASPLWQRIQAEIDHEISSRQPVSFLGRLWQKQFQLTFSMPQLATAAGLVIAAAVSLSVIARVSPDTLPGINVGWQNAQVAAKPLAQPSAVIPVELERSLIDYNERIQQRMSSWDPQMREVFQRNMAVVDLCAERCRRLLEENPNDLVAREMLHGAYNKKLRLLKDYSEF